MFVCCPFVGYGSVLWLFSQSFKYAVVFFQFTSENSVKNTRFSKVDLKLNSAFVPAPVKHEELEHQVVPYKAHKSCYSWVQTFPTNWRYSNKTFLEHDDQTITNRLPD